MFGADKSIVPPHCGATNHACDKQNAADPTDADGASRLVPPRRFWRGGRLINGRPRTPRPSSRARRSSARRWTMRRTGNGSRVLYDAWAHILDHEDEVPRVSRRSAGTLPGPTLTAPAPFHWERLLDTTHRLAELLRRRFELSLAIQPHAESPIQDGDQIEAFLERTDPNLVSLCLDTGHLAYRGINPVELLRRHHSRIRYLHLKDVNPETRKEVVEAEAMHYPRAVHARLFCPPGKGEVDFEALRRILEEVQFKGWAVVDQDLYSVPFDTPLPIAKSTREYLSRIEFG